MALTTEPSPIVNGQAVEAFADKLKDARERYMGAIDEALDAELDRLILPGDKIAVLHDAALFALFMIAVKAAEATSPRGVPLDRKAALRQWWAIQKKVVKEVPVVLLEFGREAEAARVEGTGESAT